MTKIYVESQKKFVHSFNVIQVLELLDCKKNATLLGNKYL